VIAPDLPAALLSLPTLTPNPAQQRSPFGYIATPLPERVAETAVRVAQSSALQGLTNFGCNGSNQACVVKCRDHACSNGATLCKSLPNCVAVALNKDASAGTLKGPALSFLQYREAFAESLLNKKASINGLGLNECSATLGAFEKIEPERVSDYSFLCNQEALDLDQPKDGKARFADYCRWLFSTKLQIPRGNIADLYQDHSAACHPTAMTNGRDISRSSLLKARNHPIRNFLRTLAGQLWFINNTRASYLTEFEGDYCVPSAMGSTIAMGEEIIRFEFSGSGLNQASAGKPAVLSIIVSDSLPHVYTLLVRLVGPAIVAAAVSACYNSKLKHTVFTAQYTLPVEGDYLLEVFVPWVDKYPASQLVYQGKVDATVDDTTAPAHTRTLCSRADHTGYWKRATECEMPFCRSNSSEWKLAIFDDLHYNSR
jgi:hypothetical protein